MSLQISANSRHVLDVKNALDALALPSSKRFALLKDLGRYEIAQTKQRIRQQKQVDGQSFEAGKKKKRVLLGFQKGIEPYVLNGAKELCVTWKNKQLAQKAMVHQHGITTTATAKEYGEQQNKRFGEPKYRDLATSAQAKSLVALGYKRGKETVSKKEITQSMRQGQAGLLIRKLRTGKEKGKQSWAVEMPKREFLGSPNELIKERLINNINQARR